MELDFRYERIQGPKWYCDLSEERRRDSVDSGWFQTHQEYDGDEYVGAPPVLGETTNTETAKRGGAPSDPDAKQQQPIKKKTNIVTSWGEDAVKKRKAEDGASEKRARKAVKGQEAVAEAEEPAPARARRFKAEGRRDSSKKLRLSKSLKLIRATMKAKSCTTSSRALSLAAQSLAVKSLASLRGMPARSTKITMVEDVELHTSKRAAAHQAREHQVVGRHGDGDGHGGDDAGSQGDTEEGSPYKPLVLRVKEFDKTPGRFKRVPEPPPPAKPLHVTEPKEPELHTSTRVRPSVFKPREVQEEEEMANMPVFKASTLNPLILSTSGQLGVHRVEKRDITAPRPFNFVTDDRAEARQRRQQEREQQEQEHQQPRRKHQAAAGERQTASDGEGPDRAEKALAAKARKSVACHLTHTVLAKSPMLHTKFRARKVEREEERYEFHARPVPKYLSMPSLELPRNLFADGVPAPTEPKPFRLVTQERGARHRSQLASKLAEEERAAQRARIPRANGLPLSTDMPLVPPKPEPRGLTMPEPFSLISEVRHNKYEEQKRRELEEEEAAKRAEAEFKARPMWKGIPFRIHDVDMPITVPEPVSLRTSARAVTREEFNKLVEEKKREEEAAAKRAEEERQRQEEEERRKLRKAANFVARPMPDLSAPPPAKPPPPKPLTKPVSPVLGRRKRRKTHRSDEADEKENNAE